MRSHAAALLLPLLLAASAGAQATTDLTDAEVAHVAVTANTIDVNAGKFALTVTTNAQVKAFANTMITDHSAVNAQAGALAKKLGVTPKDNAVSHSLLTGAAAAHKSMEALKGAAFDKAYINREVAYHQAVLDALDKLLVPTTENAELKKLLTDVRPAFVAHSAHAKDVQKALGN